MTNPAATAVSQARCTSGTSLRRRTLAGHATLSASAASGTSAGLIAIDGVTARPAPAQEAGAWAAVNTGLSATEGMAASVSPRRSQYALRRLLELVDV
ncbi:hypothetical protein GBF35_28550 [Nonomuraea phyllanthi]|uniref:hypothetical protein n=1 Tax=Nonomuraea phyllanthi TaxID=2219224 RepID=UPI0012930BFE|nr:hypothetical protein [Nonomuraea phyllanthi]QFY10067.1 hypothetical protein GBF35_28550 [Nonomuraea phyllanthi]